MKGKKKNKTKLVILIVEAVIIVALICVLVVFMKNGHKEDSKGNAADDVAAEDNEQSHELFEQFLAGEIDASYLNFEGDMFELSASELDLDGEEWDSFHFYGYVDVDNDGEDELVLQGPYGFGFFDVWDGKVVEFAAGEGNGSTCLMSNYDGACWIVYAYAGAEEDYYSLNKYSGSELIVSNCAFSMRTDESGKQAFYADEEEISEEEFNEFIETLVTPEPSIY